MNLGSSAIVLRPRTTSEILDLGCRLTVSLALPLYLRIAAMTLLPVYAALLALHHFGDVAYLDILLIAFPLAVWLEGPFTVAASRVLFDDPVTARRTLAIFFGRFWSYTMALVVDAIVVALGTAMLLIGLFAVWPHGTYITEASILERASFGEARTRSKRMIVGRNSEVMAALLGFTLIRLGLGAGAEILGQALVSDVLQLGHPFGTVLRDYGSPFVLLGLLCAAPAVATTRFLHYLDTRTRSDGWDIQVRFMAIQAREDERVRTGAHGLA